MNKEWKLVTLGGVAGILMGAGSLYAGQVVTKELESEDSAGSDSDNHATDGKLEVAEVEQRLSFGQAFAAARAEVGPGGVFFWHGGIYNTYTAEEWNAMTHEEKNEFAQRVQPEIHQPEMDTEDVQVINPHADDNDTQDGDVHIVGYANVQGHLAVGLDINSDGTADVAIIDVDDNQEISDPDIVVDRVGNMSTIGEIVHGNQPNVESTNEYPDSSGDVSVETNYPLYDI